MGEQAGAKVWDGINLRPPNMVSKRMGSVGKGVQRRGLDGRRMVESGRDCR